MLCQEDFLHSLVVTSESKVLVMQRKQEMVQVMDSDSEPDWDSERELLQD